MVNRDEPHPEQQYLDAMRRIWTTGVERIDRTGVGTRALWGVTMRFDLADGTVPLLTTKRIFWKAAVRELLWFLRGETNIRALVADGVHIWTDWPLDHYRRTTGDDIDRDVFEARIVADADFAACWGELGPVYGKQWRRWQGADGREHDQIAALVAGLKRAGHRAAATVTGAQDLAVQLASIVQPGDQVICLGAGDITKWAAGLAAAIAQARA